MEIFSKEIDGEQMKASGGRKLRGGSIEQKEKGQRTYGHGQQCGDCWRRVV